jgi:hypothetical protein
MKVHLARVKVIERAGGKKGREREREREREKSLTFPTFFNFSI